jgi:hypothetical protein
MLDSYHQKLSLKGSRTGEVHFKDVHGCSRIVCEKFSNILRTVLKVFTGGQADSRKLTKGDQKAH